MTTETTTRWPDGFGVQQIRVARPTDRLAEVVRFYRDGLGLPELHRFTGHAGYDGVMLGLPGKPYHLEFTHRADGSPCPAPTRDNLLVFYLPDTGAVATTVNRLAAMGYPRVQAENPYWEDNHAITIEDPDGWRIVLVPSPGI
jgi:catechol 2,3-dioxygenase-like lactoylglutathione lyase family enzyme